ncbi:MAG: outer membrane beta-barrel protein [Hoylesella marshii]|uniref:outer membrane beta-barrel protein n=1 Tax=Hoylesella marshii TaxID=189722 RepID=UPI003F9F7F8E
MTNRTFLILSFLLAATVCRGQNDSVRIDSVLHALPEVMVKGERPIVKVENGQLVYDVQRLTVQRGINNLYDAVKELPGIMEQNKQLLLGGQPVTLIIDGKVTTMSAEQVKTLLQSMPVSRSNRIEVMYNAPARYQVRGAVINISLNHTATAFRNVQGELNGNYEQTHDATFNEGVSLIYSDRHLSADILYTFRHGNTFSALENIAQHSQSDGTTHRIESTQRTPDRFRLHNYRLGLDYTFTKNHVMSFVYSGSYESSDGVSRSIGMIVSRYTYDTHNTLHNLRWDYRLPFGLKAGVEYTHYDSPETRHLTSNKLGTKYDFRADNGQRINRWKAFLSQEHDIKGGWGINYGAIFTHTNDHSFQHYVKTDAGAADVPSNSNTRKVETLVNIYAGCNKAFGKKLNADFSLAAEYYHNEAWKRWDFYPVFNLTYRPSVTHIWQLGLSSNKRFPPFWTLSDFTAYMYGGYGEVHGDPHLRPSNNYTGSLVYLFKRKYQLKLWFSHTDRYFTQLPYQRQDKLIVDYRYLNFNYQQQGGLQAYVPINIGQRLRTNIIALGIWQHEKAMRFHDIPFNRKRIFVMGMLKNTFTVASKPDIAVNLDGKIRTKALQGIYDLPTSGSVDFLARWNFDGNHATLRLYCNDLFRTSVINPEIDYATQHLRMHYSCYQEVGLSFTYRFGGYKEKKREEVDTSRFK